MKKIFILFLTLSILFTLSACEFSTNQNDNSNYNVNSEITESNNLTITTTEKLPFEDDMDFHFLSGVGGWSTDLTLSNDGSFVGSFHDSEMGSIGDGYPKGTYYVCEFSGKFTDIKKIDEYSYSMTLSDIKLKHTPETEWIEDEIKYIASGPYGLEGGKDFVFYLPSTPLTVLSEDFLSWWPHRFDFDNQKTTLSCYGILNKSTSDGFFNIM